MPLLGVEVVASSLGGKPAKNPGGGSCGNVEVFSDELLSEVLDIFKIDLLVGISKMVLEGHSANGEVRKNRFFVSPKKLSQN